MPEIKISALDLAPVTPTGTEVFAVVQGSTTHKTTIDSLKPALVDNLSTGAPTWDVNGNLTAGYNIIAGGNHDGKVGLTINDNYGYYGNANLTFNHTDGIPDVSGSSARIAVSVDSNQEVMDFQLKGSVTAGTPATLTSVLKLQDNNIQLLKATTCLTPTQNTHVARKDYVDTALNLKATTASVTAVSQSLTNHIGATTSHTKAQVGLGSVDNTTDINKPISTATQTALNGKIGESEINTSHFTFASNTLSLNTIVEGQIGTGAVTATKIGTGEVTPGKLSTGAPTWTENGRLTVDGEIRVGEDTGDGVSISYIKGSRVGTLDTLILEGNDVIDIKTSSGTESSIKIFGSGHPTVPNQIYHKADFHIFQNKEGGEVAQIPPTSTPTEGNHLVRKDYVDTAIETELQNVSSTGVSLERTAEFTVNSTSYQTVPLSVTGQPDYFTNNGDNTFTLLAGNYLMWLSFSWKTRYYFQYIDLQLTTVSGMADFAGIGVFTTPSRANAPNPPYVIKQVLLDAQFRSINQPTTFKLQIKDNRNYWIKVKDVVFTILKV